MERFLSMRVLMWQNETRGGVSMLRIGVSLSPAKTKFGPLLFAGDLFPALEQVKAYGYDGVELSLLDSQKIDQDRIMEELDRLGLRAFAIATGQTYVTDGFCLTPAMMRKGKEASKGFTIISISPLSSTAPSLLVESEAR